MSDLGWTTPSGTNHHDLAAYRALAAVLPEPHWLLSADGRVIAVNPPAARLVGRSPDELAGHSFHTLVTDDPAKVARFLAMCARTPEMVPGAAKLRTASGDAVSVRCDGALLRAGTPGAPPIILLRCRPRDAAASRFVALTERVDALHREIARRREAERVLRQQAELLDQTRDAIFVWQLDGGGITYLNRAAEELYGCRLADALGQRTHHLLRTETPRGIEELERAVRETGEWSGELVHTASDGRRLIVESRMALLRADGEPPLVLETVRDVTAARRARSQVETAQRLEAVGRLAGGVAHEINNALQGALGFAALALRWMQPGDPARDDVREALKATERAATITHGLLAFSRRQVLQPSDVSLGAVVQEFAPMLKQALGSDHELTLQFPPSPVVVHADRGQLEQVLLNFVLNSRDAMAAGGRVTIRVDAASLSAADLTRLNRPDLAPGPYARLEIADTGHGMDQATVARIFEPFFTTKPPGQGTGLGLAVVHGIVHQSGGAIEARSATGRGTTFIVYLPESATASAPLPRPETRSQGGAERVLVVDDEPVVLHLASRLLRDEGYTVLTATDGAEALQQIEEARSADPRSARPPVDLVLSDIVMPVMGGRELGSALARRHPGIPILYTSGHPGEEMVQRGLIADGAAFIQKPFHPDQLLQQVRDLLDRTNGSTRASPAAERPVAP